MNDTILAACIIATNADSTAITYATFARDALELYDAIRAACLARRHAIDDSAEQELRAIEGAERRAYQNAKCARPDCGHARNRHDPDIDVCREPGCECDVFIEAEEAPTA